LSDTSLRKINRKKVFSKNENETIARIEKDAGNVENAGSHSITDVKLINVCSDPMQGRL
jgi:hypothetical protein